MKYEYKLCEHCREMIRKFNRAEAKRRKKLGIVGGRPRKQLDARVFDELRTGRLTIEQAARKLHVSTVTVRRRLRELEAASTATARAS